jgi:hypothetical protein
VDALASSPFPRLLSAAVFISLGALGCSDPPVARIDGDAIGAKEFARQLRILKSLRPDMVLDEAARRQVLENAVKQRLLSLEAKKAGLDREPGYAEALSKSRQEVRAELQETLKNAQAQLQQLERASETKLLLSRLAQSRRAALPVSEAEIQAAYKQLKERSGKDLAPLSKLRAQLSEQILLDKLVEQAKQGRRIEVYPDEAARAALD